VTEQIASGLAPGWCILRAWARRSAGQNETSLELRCGREARRVEVPVAWPSHWLQLVASVPVGLGGSCTIALRTEAAGGGRANFDDIELVPGAAFLEVLGANVPSLKSPKTWAAPIATSAASPATP
jgi:hypothetical protein